MQLLREIGAGRPGLITHVGLGTFADPRHRRRPHEPTRANANRPRTELITIDGRELLRYLPFPVDVAIDPRHASPTAHGNLSLDPGAGRSRHLCGRARRPQQRRQGDRAGAHRVVARGTMPARAVRVPGALVDAVVAIADQPQGYDVVYDPDHVGRDRRPARFRPPPSRRPSPCAQIIARRAADEARDGAVLNYGFGIPDGIPGILAERGTLDSLLDQTIEHGTYGGELLDGDAVRLRAHAIPSAIDSPTRQFDFYSGGGLDMAFLGFGEIDAAGNVNVSQARRQVGRPRRLHRHRPERQEGRVLRHLRRQGHRLWRSATAG